MKDTIKCCIISMGIGFAVGALVAASNKKFQNNIKQAKTMAMEKLDEAKEEITKIKENMSKTNEAEAQESDEPKSQAGNSKANSSKSKTKTSK